MATARVRLTTVLQLCACVACGPSAGDEHDARPARDPDAGLASTTARATAAASATEPDFAARWHDSPTFRSGSRLRARLIDGGGEATVFAGFRDTALDVDCAYDLAEDGVERCLPADGASSVYYLDPQCSQAVWRTYPNEGECREPEVPFALDGLAPNGACAEAYRTRVYRIEGPLPAAPVYTYGSEGCRLIEAPSCLRAVTLVRPEQFVRGRTRVEPTDDGVSIDWVEYDDDARYIRGLIDTKREVACWVDEPLAGQHCVPSSSAHVFLDGAHGSGQLFAGAGCSGAQAALDFSRDPCTPAAVGIVWQPTACDRYQYSLFELGAELGVVHEASESGCSLVESSPGTWFFELGPELDLDSLPVLLPARAGTGRLQATYFAGSSGRPLQVEGGFYDRTLSRACHAESLDDDTIRCAPLADSIVGRDGPFADPLCSRRLLAVEPASDGCSEAPSVAVRRAAQRDRSAAFYDVGPRFEPVDGWVFELGSGECRARSVAPGERFYALESQLDLAVMHERVD